ncbi:MAG TPA: hydroxymethylbilane synthase [Nitrospiria bacterium]|jgi:hydroxymethylbilane synthase|nr:hydroxymethylbilane synthase [Nitrospiria bacterium]
MSRKLIIGTRGSALALCQANLIKEGIEAAFPNLEVRLKKIKTTGDKITDVPLAKVGGKGLFVKEIEEALFREEIALAVHSMKDVPTFLPEGLHLAAITRREDPRDAVISRDGKRLLDLPHGARIGTSSLRRQSQIRHRRPDFEIVPLRGNLDTRLKKIEKEGLAAIVLAAAGMRRMGWEDRITEYLDPELCVPAIGQGALGLECHVSNQEINSILIRFNHAITSRCVRAERAFLKRLEGGCQVPVAAYAQIRDEERLVLEGLVASVDGKRVIRDGIAGDPEQPETLGLDLAERLLAQGAEAILREIYQ